MRRYPHDHEVIRNLYRLVSLGLLIRVRGEAVRPAELTMPRI
jgi:hypothetical protein